MTKWRRQYNEAGFYEFNGWEKPQEDDKSTRMTNRNRVKIINILLAGYILHSVMYIINKPSMKLVVSSAVAMIALSVYLLVKNNERRLK